MRAKTWAAALLLIGGAASGCSGKDRDSDRGQGAPLSIAGLSAPADVRFDAQGVLHATCRTDEDCAAVLGYFHARDRFWQMDTNRRAARGRLATLLPFAEVLEQDVQVRHFLSTRDGTPLEEAIWAEMDAPTRTMVEAYAAGVNAWLADLRAGRHGARLSAEYTAPGVAGAPTSIPDWEPQDTVAWVRLLVQMLSENGAAELYHGMIYPELPAERAVALFTLAPAARTDTMAAAGVPYGSSGVGARSTAPVDVDAIRAVQGRLGLARHALDLAQEARATFRFPQMAPAGGAAGSNNWVLAPWRTQEGKALLASDPHLDMSNPAWWYLAVVDGVSEGNGTIHAGGGTFPGMPGVLIGHNRSLAWGATVAYYDVTDVYVEALNDAGTHVFFDADGDGVPEEVEILSREVRFERAGHAPVTRTLRWVPHHGPIVAEDPANGLAITIRWTGHEPSQEVAAFLGLNRAGTVAEAKEALRRFEVGAQNWVLADRSGTIGWWPHARVPRRPWASFHHLPDGTEQGSLPPWLPLPGDGSAEWQGYLAAEELPQLLDPPNGFVATANQPMTHALEDGDPTNDGFPVLQTMAAIGFRQARIVDRLGALGNGHGPETMEALQADTWSLAGEAVVPALLEVADGAGALSAPVQQLVEVLRGWQYTCPTGLVGFQPDAPGDPDPVATSESVGCTAFHYTLPWIYEHAYGDELAAAGVPFYSHDMLLRPLVIALRNLPVPFDADLLWDDLRTPEVETREQVLLAALVDAGTGLVEALGSDLDTWRWGRHHTVTFEHLADPGLDHGPFANTGGLFTVDVADVDAEPGSLDFAQYGGASMRMVAEASAEGVTATFQLPGGQRHHLDDPHYQDLVEGWLRRVSFPLAFTGEDAAAAAQTTLRVVP